jgi:hypothetical protein
LLGQYQRASFGLQWHLPLLMHFLRFACNMPGKGHFRKFMQVKQKFAYKLLFALASTAITCLRLAIYSAL